jgi:hypothetical protein
LQQAKGEHFEQPCLLQPLAVLVRAWIIVSLDFVEGLPKTEGYDVILVVIENFSKDISWHWLIPSLLNK